MNGVQKFSSSGRGAGGWSKPVTRYMLANGEQVEALYTEATLRGWLPRVTPDRELAQRLKFFTLAAYCVRKSRPELKGTAEFIENAGAVFTRQLIATKNDASAWLGGDRDEESARRLMFPTAGRDADLLDELDHRAAITEAAERKAKALDGLRNFRSVN